MVRTSRQGAIPSDLGSLIELLRDLDSRVGTLEAPSGETAGAALPRTVSNVEELLARRTLVAESNYSAIVNAGDPLPFVTPALTPINFNIDARRRLYFKTSCYVASYSVYDGTGTVYAPETKSSLRMDLTDNSDGSVTTTSIPIEAGSPGRAGQTTGVALTARHLLDDYRILNPGDYTLAFSAAVTLLNSTASGFVSLYFPRLSVEIMEKV